MQGGGRVVSSVVTVDGAQAVAGPMRGVGRRAGRPIHDTACTVLDRGGPPYAFGTGHNNALQPAQPSYLQSNSHRLSIAKALPPMGNPFQRHVRDMLMATKNAVGNPPWRSASAVSSSALTPCIQRHEDELKQQEQFALFLATNIRGRTLQASRRDVRLLLMTEWTERFWLDERHLGAYAA